ncbi:hypothetical protein B0H11DRAFT_331561 [Mycena galericulata]|nr:hypothetical protein B0H11DRAFT_331561 [Mycena galericulata]
MRSSPSRSLFSSSSALRTTRSRSLSASCARLAPSPRKTHPRPTPPSSSASVPSSMRAPSASGSSARTSTRTTRSCPRASISSSHTTRARRARATSSPTSTTFTRSTLSASTSSSSPTASLSSASTSTPSLRVPCAPTPAHRALDLPGHEGGEHPLLPPRQPFFLPKAPGSHAVQALYSFRVTTPFLLPVFLTLSSLRTDGHPSTIHSLGQEETYSRAPAQPIRRCIRFTRPDPRRPAV